MLVSMWSAFSLISLYLQSPTFRELQTQEWKWWKNRSITETLRDHFRRHHGPTWSAVCEEQRLKGHAVQPSKSPSKSRIVGRTVFSIEEVRRRLVEWIVADDQVSVLNSLHEISAHGILYLKSLRVMDVPEFRHLLLALGAGNILDRDLPHRSGLAKLIAMRHKLEEGVLKEDLQVCSVIDRTLYHRLMSPVICSVPSVVFP